MIDKNTYEADIKFSLIKIEKDIGKDEDGLPAVLSFEIRQEFTEYERETIDHEITHSHTELSISLWIGRNSPRAYGGQTLETLKKLKNSPLSRKGLGELADIWEKWHLNDCKAGCIHQGNINVNDEDWTKLAKIETDKCPEKYSYGSKWLIEPLPYEVIKFGHELEKVLN